MTGFKYLVVGLIYAIPFLIVFFVTIGAGIIALANNPTSVMGAIGGMLFGFIVLAIIGILTMIFSTIGIIRFARTGSMGEAFNFKEILATIAKIGWVSYILALVVLMVVIEIIISILGMIPVLGIIINIVLIAPVMLFEARYLCQVYDAAGTA
ncbi:MAG: DUF4013 domain-containing protein [Methanoregula sp.]